MWGLLAVLGLVGCYAAAAVAERRVQALEAVEEAIAAARAHEPVGVVVESCDCGDCARLLLEAAWLLPTVPEPTVGGGGS